ncbi:Glycosyltransferase involved in cell wall bisynthesis [Pseudobutyrivibrio sp. YE44]|uniref:glycosyltransferase family 2 protein n=1 Tax=Pseudobutyrivibrio sp. YE44 TaxID=1520802 RepID=UPI00087F7AC8|nr:glycosyltransferase family 2 protein [Pseudobutyrivibrio sp. YE44]SDB46910.1 Glycosyltransferase involved in cell wall bisynthesis [Pseudobutyrivibrio sp. YE44]
MEKLVSIILPIYNVEKYLDRCMESVINQTYRNIEIIMVDDGATDSCPQKCEEWAKKDSRIKVVHKKNAGLGEARNTGLEHATGEFVFFLDSDDFVSKDLVAQCISKQIENDADIVLYGFSRVDGNGNVYKNNIPQPSKVLYTGNEVREDVLPALIASKGKTVSGLWMSAWCCMYSKAKIDSINWKFVSEREIIAEDVYSLLTLYSVVDRVAIVTKALYFYCDNAASLTHVFREDRIDKINHFLRESLKKVELYKYGELIEECICFLYSSFLIAALKMIIKDDNMNFITKRKKLLSSISSPECRKALKYGGFNFKRFGKSVQLLFMRLKFVDVVYLILKISSRHV